MITLIDIEFCDLPLIWSWRNSKHVMSCCRQYRPLTEVDMKKWYENLTNDSDYHLTNDMFMVRRENYCIGVAGLTRIDWRNRKAEVSFYIGDPSENNKDNITEALMALTHYAFKTLGLHKIYWPVYSFNPNLQIYEEIMEREYVAKGEYFWEGKFHDRVVLVKYEQV